MYPRRSSRARPDEFAKRPSKLSCIGETGVMASVNRDESLGECADVLEIGLRSFKGHDIVVPTLNNRNGIDMSSPCSRTSMVVMTVSSFDPLKSGPAIQSA